MPGSLPTSARRRPQMRLKSVDLPTFGRPRMATRGRLGMMGWRVPARRPMLRTRSPMFYAILFVEKSKDAMYSESSEQAEHQSGPLRRLFDFAVEVGADLQ